VFQFGLGILVFHERMSAAAWAGFGLVWSALVVLTWDGVRQARRVRTPEAVRPPVPAPAAERLGR